MQDSEEKNGFDLMCRSLLADAEEQAPSGVWEAVSAELGKGAAPVRRIAIWKWAGVSLAAAAALAAGLFFTGTFSSSTPEKIQIADNGGSLYSEAVTEVPDETNTVSGAERAPKTPIPTNINTQQESARTAPAIRLVPDTDPTAPAPQEEQEASTPDSEPVQSSSTSEKTWNEAFPTMEDDDNRDSERGKVSISFNGSISGNDSDYGRGSAAAHRANGAGSGSTGITESSISSYGLPVSFGAGIKIGLGKRFSIGTGLEWTMLTRSFSGQYSEPGIQSVSGDVNHIMHYIGIPLDLYYDIINTRSVKFYTYGGGELEYCLSNRYHMYGTTPKVNWSDPVKKLQPSLGAGLGLEFKLPNRIGLYIDPGFQYYFPSGQPKSIRTDRMFLVDFRVGLRVNL